ncbi:hypothetical protein D910_07105 [Dendroctonus ponderosae]
MFIHVPYLNSGVPPLNGKTSDASTVPAAALDEDTRDTTASFADTDGSPIVSVEDDLCENSASASSVSESTKDSMQDDDSNSIGFVAKRPLDSAIDGPPSAKKAREEAK